ncbi:MAG: flagellar type III secretion system pore protein FliP [Candidatus Eisenbacteria bacterium]|nr:flagellar type III secretion system pore protein FliP [Candidatus Eisenbacteria bacterium]MCC7142729.1 flagellar type III secretion system pore protein FliP [Candidatus Eisenbacteria bacterium]
MSVLRPRALWFALMLVLALGVGLVGVAQAQPTPGLRISLDGGGEPKQVATSLQILLIITVLSLVPAILLMFTSFARIVVVLSFLRQAMSTPQLPPNQVLISLALFLTLFTMGPTLNTMNTTALQPYLEGKATAVDALKSGSAPLRDFMLRQTREKDLALFVQLSKAPRPESASDLPLTVITPAFMISELKTAFQIGFMLYLPFLIIDLVVASVLMSMGMMMLPPAMISLPFKILLFVLVDGWNLVTRSLVASFH